jgi:hypothetical protein
MCAAFSNLAEQFLAAARLLKLNDVNLEINLSDEDRNAADIFGNQVQASRACRHLYNFGLNPNIVARACIMFWLMKPLDPETVRPQLERARGCPYKRRVGRPQRIYSAFQLVCDQWVSDRSDGLRFYREFCELAAMVFGHKPPTFRANDGEMQSYKRRLKRIRHAIVVLQRAMETEHKDTLLHADSPPLP